MVAHRRIDCGTGFSSLSVTVCTIAPSSSTVVERLTTWPPTPPPETWSVGIVAPLSVVSSVWEYKSVSHFSPTFSRFDLSHVETELLNLLPGVFSTLTSAPSSSPSVEAAVRWFLCTRVTRLPFRVTLTVTEASTTSCSCRVCTVVSYLPSGRSSLLWVFRRPSTASGASGSGASCPLFTSLFDLSSMFSAVAVSEVTAFASLRWTVTLYVQSSLACVCHSIVVPAGAEAGVGTATGAPVSSVNPVSGEPYRLWYTRTYEESNSVSAVCVSGGSWVRAVRFTST